MKKVFLMLVAVGAMTFVSCDNKPKANVEEVAEEVTLTAEDADAAANDVITNLTEALNGTDASKLQEIVEKVKEKAAEYVSLNPEIAKEFVAKVQTFLKENADKVKALVGSNAAVGAAVAALTDMDAESIVNNFLANPVEQAVEGAKDAVEGAAQDAAQAVENAKDAAAEKVNETVDAAKEKAAETVDAAADAAKKKLGL